MKADDFTLKTDLSSISEAAESFEYICINSSFSK